ncbi:thiolase family protein [Aureispira anguillae]|uniref:Thiolase family protein n=1 Tax=Aureispira anguillae TaxID=2864201 RepID=A0A916DSS0_9BACT|nr:thiolase family protein [Aureispira anguillae]BDS10991.1 thiolase family protein [Aureispira anguillae]
MNNKNQTIYIIDALRSPIGKLYGALSHIRPDDLASLVIQELIAKNNLEKASIDGVILGCANQAGEDNRNVARMASLLAGLPYSAVATTINSLCSSGMEAIISASRSIALGEGDCYIAGGIESMSRSPLITSKVDKSTVNSLIGWRFVNPKIYAACPTLSMPETAELLAKNYNINRDLQDEYAYQSRLKYQTALERSIWSEEILPIKDHKNKLWQIDEQHRILSLDLLSKLPKLVENGHCISSGNAARIGDGAAIVALASESYIKRHNIQPLAQVKTWASAACHPSNMGLSAVAATQKVMQRTDLQLQELDWIEMSESFAVQALVCIQELGLDPEKVNPYGGALTAGNPISVSAARLVVSLAKEMGRNPNVKNGLAAACAGLGTGAALILEQA